MLAGWLESAHCWESYSGPTRGCLNFLGTMCSGHKIQGSSWRRQKGQEHRPQWRFPGISLVCGVGRNSQGHGVINTSATCPPSKGRKTCQVCQEKQPCGWSWSRGTHSTFRGWSEKDASVIQPEQDCLSLLSMSLDPV